MFWTEEVLSESIIIAKKYVTSNLTLEKWKLFPMYMEQKLIRVLVDATNP